MYEMRPEWRDNLFLIRTEKGWEDSVMYEMKPITDEVRAEQRGKPVLIPGSDSEMIRVYDINEYRRLKASALMKRR